MALAPCRECGREVSTEAANCPQCGVPHPTRQPIEASAAALDTTANEDVIYEAHVHPVIYFWPFMLSMVAILTIILKGNPPWLTLTFGVLAAVAWLVAYVVAHSVDFIVTTKRVATRTGILQKNSQETLLEKVETVGVHQDLLGRILNYGTVTVVGTGGSHDVFRRISKPLELRRRLHDQIDQRKAFSN
jgi:uncharacterized membrane protein YdbT with pleckstrin-like domain